MANLTPASRAARMWSDGRSSRCGEALISSAVPVRAQARNSSPKSDLDRRPLADPPGGRVADDVDVRVLAGGDEPPGHLRPGLLEVRVHRGDADVEPGQEVRVPVHRAVRADVELGAVQQHDAPGEVCCQRPHLLPLGQHLLVGHPLHDQVRRVVGDGVVLVSAPPRRVDHRLERGHPVGEVGVRVQVPSQVIDPNEPWVSAPAPPPRPPRGPPAWSGASTPGPAVRRPPPRSVRRSARLSRHRTVRTRIVSALARTAIWRTATLCAAEPVKYCSAAPQASSGTTRRSTVQPASGPDRGLGRAAARPPRPGGKRRHQRRRVAAPRRGCRCHRWSPAIRRSEPA